MHYINLSLSRTGLVKSKDKQGEDLKQAEAGFSAGRHAFGTMEDHLFAGE